MKSRASLTRISVAVALTVACWSGLQTIQAESFVPAQTQEVELRTIAIGDCETPPNIPEDTEEATSIAVQAGDLANPRQLHRQRSPLGSALRYPWRVALGLTLRGLQMSGSISAAAAVPPAGVLPYPVQPTLDVAWTLQGLADDEEQAGEGDVAEYGG